MRRELARGDLKTGLLGASADEAWMKLKETMTEVVKKFVSRRLLNPY